MILCGLLVWPAQSIARALVRLIDAVPGSGRIGVQLRTRTMVERLRAIAFAEVTKWRGLRSGSFRFSLVQHNPRSSTVGRGATRFTSGALDLVLLARPDGRTTLGVYPARAGVRGHSLLRVIHAAPELGAPELKLDGRRISTSLAYGHATRYLRVAPGMHDLAAFAPGSSTPLVAVPRLRLRGGESYTEILVGTRGERLRWVTVIDRGAPLTRVPSGPPHSHNATGGSVVVGRGDSLWTIAARRLGPGASDGAIAEEVAAIWNLNASRIGTGDPNLIFPGQVILFPLAITT